MKKALAIFGVIGIYAYVGFVPPDGKSKLPADIELTINIPEINLPIDFANVETDDDGEGGSDES